MPKMTIRGLQQAQMANANLIANLKPSAGMGRAVQYATIQAQRYAVSITHVITGALRASHRMELHGLKGRIYLDPAARNPRTGQLTSQYGRVEHARGGKHAFYARTEAEAGRRIAQAAAAGFVRSNP